jgi:hypothetical protein
MLGPMDKNQGPLLSIFNTSFFLNINILVPHLNTNKQWRIYYKVFNLGNRPVIERGKKGHKAKKVHFP